MDADLKRRVVGVMGHFATTISVYPERLEQGRKSAPALFAWLGSLDEDVEGFFAALSRLDTMFPGFDHTRPTLFGLIATEQDQRFQLAKYGVPLSGQEASKFLHVRANFPVTDVAAFVEALEVRLGDWDFLPLGKAPEELRLPGVTDHYMALGGQVVGITRGEKQVMVDLFFPTSDDLDANIFAFATARLKRLQTPKKLHQDAATLHFLEGHGALAMHLDMSRLAAYLGEPVKEDMNKLRYAPQERFGSMFRERHHARDLMSRWLWTTREGGANKTLSIDVQGDRPHVRLTENLRVHARDAYKKAAKTSAKMLPERAPTLFSLHIHEAMGALMGALPPGFDGMTHKGFRTALDVLDHRSDILFGLFLLEHPWLSASRGLKDVAPKFSLLPDTMSLLYEAESLENEGSVAFRASFPGSKTKEDVEGLDLIATGFLSEVGVGPEDPNLKLTLSEEKGRTELRLAYAQSSPLFASKTVQRAPGVYASADMGRVSSTVSKVDPILGGALSSLGRVQLVSKVFGDHRATILGWKAVEAPKPVRITGVRDVIQAPSPGEVCLRREFRAIAEMVPASPDRASLAAHVQALEARSKGPMAAALACARKDPRTAEAAKMLPSTWAYVMADMAISTRLDQKVVDWLAPACEERRLDMCTALKRFQPQPDSEKTP